MQSSERLTSVEGDRIPSFPEAAAIVVVNQHNKVLLMQRVDYGGGFGLDWVFPGGGVEQGEKHISTARRELLEEAGIALEEDKNIFFPLTRYITAPNSLGVQHDLIIYVSYYYADQIEPRIASPDEMVSWGWFNPDEVLNLVSCDKMKMLQSMILGMNRIKNYLSNKNEHRYGEVFVGGNFNLLYDKERKLLSTAFESADYVYIGLKQDTLNLPPFSHRLHELRKYLYTRGVLNRAVIISFDGLINQKSLDPKLDGIVVNGDNMDYEKQINSLRVKFKIPMAALIVSSNKDNCDLQKKLTTEVADYSKQFI